ncbi:hypothetical protein VTN00DRAFT_10381 [Thermoascus crustaceus]|uniref:uncharacterized protein n=1 Tax=Thermoascus crustaceus TaxID=5088 RepID=UPI00374211F8
MSKTLVRISSTIRILSSPFHSALLILGLDPDTLLAFSLSEERLQSVGNRECLGRPTGHLINLPALEYPTASWHVIIVVIIVYSNHRRLTAATAAAIIPYQILIKTGSYLHPSTTLTSYPPVNPTCTSHLLNTTNGLLTQMTEAILLIRARELPVLVLRVQEGRHHMDDDEGGKHAHGDPGVPAQDGDGGDGGDEEENS